MLDISEVASWLSIRQLEQFTRHHSLVRHLKEIGINVKIG